MMLDGASLARPGAVIFDWDNTLVDSWPVIHDATNWTLARFGKPTWTYDETRRRVRKSLRDAFPTLFGDDWEAAGEAFYERYDEIHADLISPIAGVTEMLEEFCDSGIFLGVVSNKRGDFLRLEAERLGWTDFFGALVGAYDAEQDKPARAPVDLALQDSDLPEGAPVWFVGDTDIDLECAVNAGCLPVLLRPEPPQSGEFKTYPPALYAGDCEALCKLVRTL